MVPIGETAGVTRELPLADKIRAIVMSNFHPRIQAPLSTNQPPHDQFERRAETGILP
jgi:aryl-alcohol dehydrogenase-like predicted oxidoreductase